MNSEELNAAVYNKMNREQAIYLDWLESLPPHEILQHAYEYTVRQDILFAMEYMELQPEQCEALLRSKDISNDSYPKETKTYNLLGIPVDDNYKGIVIRNGKKYYNK